jgi:hypothetical protein
MKKKDTSKLKRRGAVASTGLFGVMVKNTKSKLLPIDPIGQANLSRAIQLLRFVIQGLESVQAASDILDKQRQPHLAHQSVRRYGQRKRNRGQRVAAAFGTSGKTE